MTNLSIYLQEYARGQKIAPGQWSAMVLAKEPFDLSMYRTNLYLSIYLSIYMTNLSIYLQD